MGRLDEIGGWLEDRLPQLLTEHKIPGAAVAVAAGGEIVEHAAGLLSKATGVEATVDSVFQVGSITKLWTATLVQQLADEGMLDLDRPVREYVPEFTVADADAAKTITVRQLLCHTSGFEGDLFTDTGRGDDCVDKYVRTLADTPQLFRPGEMFSYNNAGYCVLGRIVEVLRDRPYNTCLREHLIGPLGLAHATTTADEAILHRAAVGHLQPEPEADPQPAPVWSLVASNAPAGSLLAMCPRDLLAFARLHLGDGAAADGTRLLSTGAVHAMRERQVELPYLGVMGNAWGLGWEIFDWPGGPVVGHDGGTIGQSAFFRMVPGRGVALALLTNGGNAIPAYAEIFGRTLRELADVELPPFPVPKQTRVTGPDLDRYLGTYSSTVADTVISRDGDTVWAERTPKGVLAEMGIPVERHELATLRGDTLVTKDLQHGIHMPYAFLGDDRDGRATYLHTGRADPRRD